MTNKKEDTMTAKPQANTLDEILTKAFNDFYDYIIEKDMLKVAREYSEKTVYKSAKQHIQALITESYERGVKDGQQKD